MMSDVLYALEDVIVSKGSCNEHPVVFKFHNLKLLPYKIDEDIEKVRVRCSYLFSKPICGGNSVILVLPLMLSTDRLTRSFKVDGME